MNTQQHIEVIIPYHPVRHQQVDLSLNGPVAMSRTGYNPWQATRSGRYRRSKPELSPDAIADLEEYFTHLRNYYDIPDSQPVFPPIPKRDRAKQLPKEQCIATGKNRNDHPWRTT